MFCGGLFLCLFVLSWPNFAVQAFGEIGHVRNALTEGSLPSLKGPGLAEPGLEGQDAAAWLFQHHGQKYQHCLASRGHLTLIVRAGFCPLFRTPDVDVEAPVDERGLDGASSAEVSLLSPWSCSAWLANQGFILPTASSSQVLVLLESPLCALWCG